MLYEIKLNRHKCEIAFEFCWLAGTPIFFYFAPSLHKLNQDQKLKRYFVVCFSMFSIGRVAFGKKEEAFLCFEHFDIFYDTSCMANTHTMLYVRTLRAPFFTMAAIKMIGHFHCGRFNPLKATMPYRITFEYI